MNPLFPYLKTIPPRPFEQEWQQTADGAKSIRSVIPEPSGGFVSLAPQMDDEDVYMVVKRNEQGGEIWKTNMPEHGEGTDIAILTKNGENTGYAVTGHKGIEGGIDDAITKFNTSGNIEWNKNYGNPIGGSGEFAGLEAGNPRLIFDECWGIQDTPEGGAVIACGTGIEGCDEYESRSEIRAECQSDPRTKWCGMLIVVDENGSKNWFRTDSYYFPEDNETAESASEFIILAENGDYVSVVDQGFGIGLLRVSSTPN